MTKTVMIRVSPQVREKIYSLAKDGSEYPDQIMRRLLKMPELEYSRVKTKVFRGRSKPGKR